MIDNKLSTFLSTVVPNWDFINDFDTRERFDEDGVAFLLIFLATVVRYVAVTFLASFLPSAPLRPPFFCFLTGVVDCEFGKLNTRLGVSSLLRFGGISIMT